MTGDGIDNDCDGKIDEELCTPENRNKGKRERERERERERVVLYKVNLSYSRTDDNLYLQMTTEMERLMKIVLSPRLVSIAPPIHTPTPVCFLLLNRYLIG